MEDVSLRCGHKQRYLKNILRLQNILSMVFSLKIGIMLPRFSDEEAEIQGGKAAGPRSHSQYMEGDRSPPSAYGQVISVASDERKSADKRDGKRVCPR